MDKTREELEEEYAANVKKLERYRHKQQQIENRIRYYTQGERKKRTRRLITRGAAVERIVPQVRDMDERTFFVLMEHVFSLPEVAALVGRIAEGEEG